VYSAAPSAVTGVGRSFWYEKIARHVPFWYRTLHTDSNDKLDGDNAGAAVGLGLLLVVVPVVVVVVVVVSVVVLSPIGRNGSIVGEGVVGGAGVGSTDKSELHVCAADKPRFGISERHEHSDVNSQTQFCKSFAHDPQSTSMPSELRRRQRMTGSVFGRAIVVHTPSVRGLQTCVGSFSHTPPHVGGPGMAK